MPSTVLKLFTDNNAKIDQKILEDDTFQIDFEELSSHQAKYLCIITSGHLEKSLQDIGTKYKTDGGISGCAKFLGNMRNPKWCNVLSYLVNIDARLISALDYKVTNKEQIKNHLDMLSTARNNIAHGKTAEITIHDMDGIIQSVDKLIKSIKEIVEHHISEIESSI